MMRQRINLLLLWASQILLSYKLICQQWYHPSQFRCSQFWIHLWCWLVFLWSDQLSVQILSFPHPRYSSNSSSSSSPCSYITCEFTCLQQTWLLQSTSLWHLTNKSQQTSTHSKFIGTRHHKHFKISTHHTDTKKQHWLPIEQRIEYELCLLIFKTQINNLHIFTIVFHFSHTLFLQDLLIHSFFPFHMSDHHLAEGRSLSLVQDFGIHYLRIPEIRIIYQSSVPGSKHTSKFHSLPRLFPIFLDCLSGFWFLLFSFYALSNITNNSWH